MAHCYHHHDILDFVSCLAPLCRALLPCFSFTEAFADPARGPQSRLSRRHPLLHDGKATHTAPTPLSWNYSSSTSQPVSLLLQCLPAVWAIDFPPPAHTDLLFFTPLRLVHTFRQLPAWTANSFEASSYILVALVCTLPFRPVLLRLAFTGNGQTDNDGDKKGFCC
ncbi:hypothetical protein PMIN04_002468 [Paraphaeosphaeria minitans]